MQITLVGFDKPVKVTFGRSRSMNQIHEIAIHKFQIDATKRYTASVVVTGASTYYGYSLTSSTTVSTEKGDVVFNFMESELSTNTTETQAVIPQFVFRA